MNRVESANDINFLLVKTGVMLSLNFFGLSREKIVLGS